VMDAADTLYVPSAQSNAVKTYTGIGYGSLNYNLRNKVNLTTAQTEVRRELDAHMQKSTFKKDVILHRGYGDDPLYPEGANTYNLDESPPPPECMEREFASASINPKVSLSSGFVGSSKDPTTGKIMPHIFRIRVPA